MAEEWDAVERVPTRSMGAICEPWLMFPLPHRGRAELLLRPNFSHPHPGGAAAPPYRFEDSSLPARVSLVLTATATSHTHLP